MRSAVAAGNVQIADARGAGRFEGRDPEPRPGLRSGHMPGAHNVPFTTLLTPEGTLRSAAELRRVFEAAGIDVLLGQVGQAPAAQGAGEGRLPLAQHLVTQTLLVRSANRQASQRHQHLYSIQPTLRFARCDPQLLQRLLPGKT